MNCESYSELELEKKLDENPGDTESRKRLTGILAARGDPQAELHEWMLKNEIKTGKLTTAFNDCRYYWGDLSARASSPQSLLAPEIHNLLECDFKEGMIHWKYYKSRLGAELALFEALNKLGVLPFEKVKNDTFFDGLPIKKLDTSIKIPIGFFGEFEGEREKEIKRLQTFLDAEPTNWEYRQRLGILLQATDQKASQIQMWMAENQKCPLHCSPGDPVWWLGNPEDYRIKEWSGKDSMSNCYLPLETLNKLKMKWWDHSDKEWKGYKSRIEAEKDMENILS